MAHSSQLNNQLNPIHMKNLIFLLFVLVSLKTVGQSFEGTITWKDPTDASGKSSTLNLKVKGTTIITQITGGMMNGMEMWFMDNDTKIMRVMRAQKMVAV